MNPKGLLRFIFTAAFVILFLPGCAGLTDQETPVAVQEGDRIGTAVAGTLQASTQGTATTAAQRAETADAQATQAAVQATTQTAAATASAVAAMPTLEPTPSATNPISADIEPTVTSGPPSSVVVTNDLLVAYVGSSRDLWIWRDGAARQLTNTGDVMEVSVSDDSAWIAFTRSTNLTHYSLWVVRPNGTNEQPLMETAEFEAIPHDVAAVTVVPVSIAWQPQSHVLAFSTRPTFEGPGLMLSNDLWLIDVDSRERRELLPAGEGGRFYYSPDGSQIALVQPTSISLVDADGSNRRDEVLTYSEVSTYSEYQFYAVPQWLPNSSALRVVIPPPASLENPDEDTTVWEIPVDGTAARQLSSVRTAALFFPVLSPDASKLAYLRQVGDAAENRLELHIASVDGSSDINYLADGMLQFMSWAPDSRRFAYSIGEDNRTFLGEVNTSPQPLTDTNTAMEVRWLDANHFFFIARDESGFQLRMGTLGAASAPIIGGAEATDHFPMYDFVIP